MSSDLSPTFDCDIRVIGWQTILPRSRVWPHLGILWSSSSDRRAFHHLRALTAAVEALDGCQCYRPIQAGCGDGGLVRN